MNAPGTISIIIHYFCNPTEDYPDSVFFKKECKKLLSAGLLVNASSASPREFEPNREACNVYLDALGNVPFPTQGWVINKEN